MNIILIYKTLRSIYDSQIESRRMVNWSEDYQKGYRYCLGLLILAIEMTPGLNLHVEHMRLTKRVRDLERGREKLQQDNAQLKLELDAQKKLNGQLQTLLTLQSQSNLKRMVADLQAQLNAFDLNQTVRARAVRCPVESIHSEIV